MPLISARPSFTSTHAKIIGGILFGGMALTYAGELRAKKDAESEYASTSIDHQKGGSSSDALYAVNRPAKNNNVKGGLPTASKWV